MSLELRASDEVDQSAPYTARYELHVNAVSAAMALSLASLNQHQDPSP